MDKKNPRPPKLAEAFLKWFCSEDVLETLQGDLLELYQKRISTLGKWKADLYFFLDVIDVCRPFAWKKNNQVSTNYRTMFQHNFKLAWRHFFKQRVFTLINILGLTLGFSSFLLILFYVNHEQSFDEFHTNKADVFRINISFQDNAGNVTTMVNSPPALAPGIRGKFPEVEKISRLRYAMNSLFSSGDVHFYEDHGYYADSIFLEILQFDMLSGDPNTSLDQPNSIVITKELALKYFNDPDPVGATLLFNNEISLKVTGVLSEVPENSHLNFNYLISFSTYTIPDGYSSDLSSWSWLGFLTYVELKPHADPNKFESGLAQHFQDLNPDDPTPALPIMQNLSDIYLGSSNMTDDLASHIRSGNIFTVRILMMVAILILLIAGFNFSNLSQALSINRRGATGVRKVLGADRKNIWAQILTESLIMTFFCLILSFGLVYLVFPDISQFMIWEFELGLLEILKVIPALIAVGFFVGVISALYPAQNLGRINIMKSLKGNTTGGRQNIFQIKNVLLIGQFAIAIGLISSTYIITQQINHLRNTETGYNSENVILIKMLPENVSQYFEVFKDQMVQHSSVLSMSRSERVIGEPWPFSVIRKVEEDPEMSRRIFFNQIDYDYFETMDVSLNSGRSFSKEFTNDPTKSIILNQQAVTNLGLENPIGQQVHFFELDGPRTIVGVVEDFNYTSLHQGIGPAAVMLPFIDLEYMYVRFEPGNPKSQIALLEDTWQQVSENVPMEWKFLDADLERLYQSEEKLSSMIQVFSALAILLACLGLFGMVTFLINKRIKEVAIRKILGATAQSLYTMFIKTYIYQTVLAMLIILPLTHYLLNSWLENFAYHIEISWWIYPVAAILLITMILITVTFQVLKSTLVNPSRLLRNE